MSLSLAVAMVTSVMLINPASGQAASAFCGFEVHAEHGPECYRQSRTLICGLDTEGHVHSDDCYERALICGRKETAGHTHSGSCYTSVLSCAEKETAGHTHSKKCYETRRVLVCKSKEEGHEHTDECYEEQSVPVCGLEESKGHTHSSACYTKKRVCGLKEAEGHTHTDACYAAKPTLVCGKKEAAPHVHTDACYAVEKKLICRKPLHEHTLKCFSNPKADVETVGMWEYTLRGAELTGKWSRDVLAIADTQLGYRESKRNYIVAKDGVSTRGYTRYGAWYGYPYDEWCAMFCSFCLRYAGLTAEVLPRSSSCQSWVETLSGEEYALYHEAKYYIPTPGDLVFFDWDEFDEEHPEKRVADHVGFVRELIRGEDGRLTGFKTIEGNSAEAVRENIYEIDDETVMGYAALPRNPEWFTLEAETDGGIRVTVEGLNGSLPCDGAELALSAREIDSEESALLLASQMGSDGSADMESILLDISLMRGDAAVEPVGPVYLSFETKDVDAETAVYHIDEVSETVTEMPTEVNESENTVSLETDHFSIFALTLKAKAGKNVTATVEAEWDDANNSLSSVTLKTRSTAQICHNYDVFDGSTWTVGAGTWTAKAAAGTEQTFDITARVNSSSPATKYRARVAENTGAPENDKSGCSEEFSLYDILDAAKPGFTGWLSGMYTDFNLGPRPTNAAQLFAAFDIYHDLPSLTLTKVFTGGSLMLTAATDAAFEPPANGSIITPRPAPGSR